MIHKTAILDSKAKISDNVKIGPYSVIGPDVEIGEGTVIESHVNITGYTKILKRTNTLIFLFSELKCNNKIITSASGVWKILKIK